MKATGYFFKAFSSKKEVGEIEIINRKVSIISDQLKVCENVEVESIQSRKDIYLSNGFLFTLLEPLTKEQEDCYLNKFQKAVHWLEIFSLRRAIILSIILLIGLVFLRLMLTSATQLAVTIIPKKWEETIGQNTYIALTNIILNETELSSERISKLREESAKMVFMNDLRGSEIFFHKSQILGPNALAFAGGPIVVTDELVEILNDDDLVLAVIAHELAHIEQRHSLHQIFEIVGIATIASAILGSNNTLIEEASVVALDLWASKKSREFEKEADLIALEYLVNSGIEKKSFGRVIEKLTHHVCSVNSKINLNDCIEREGGSWFSSHPLGAERLRYLGFDKRQLGFEKSKF